MSFWTKGIQKSNSIVNIYTKIGLLLQLEQIETKVVDIYYNFNYKIGRHQGWNQDSNLRVPEFFVQRFKKIGISILEVNNNALLALIF